GTMPSRVASMRAYASGASDLSAVSKVPFFEVVMRFYFDVQRGLGNSNRTAGLSRCGVVLRDRDAISFPCTLYGARCSVIKCRCMDISFNCPHCNQHLAVDESGAGMTVSCPNCNERIVIPLGATSPPPVRLVPATIPKRQSVSSATKYVD